MNRNFIPYQEAFELKQLGYPQNEYFAWYGSNELNYDSEYDQDAFTHACCAAPLYQQAFEFFRYRYNLKSCIMFRTSMEDDVEYYDWLIKGEEVIYRHFPDYKDAELACIKELIEIVKLNIKLYEKRQTTNSNRVAD